MTNAAEKESKETKGASNRRSAARLAAVQALYEMDMAGAEADDVLEDFLKKRWRFDDGSLTEPDGGWLDDLVHGVAMRRDELDGFIGQALSGAWTLDRLETLLRVILRAGNHGSCFLHELHRLLVHADHGTIRIVQPGVCFQHVLHVCDEFGVGLRRDDPILDFRSSCRFFQGLTNRLVADGLNDF